ncbi:MAG: HlyD family type I secretion periplasmic adaptor subunit [Alphaproteobacteria bacterium]|nr:HlyD family type I secretion periplasmic adaptor subunit [Alphaproteobacteria bacterium]
MNALTVYSPRAVSVTPIPHIRPLILAGAAIVGVFVLGAGVWAALAPLESAAHAPGVVEVESSRKTVQHLEGGIIGAILVQDNDRVVAGQPLIRLDDTKARTTLAALQGQLWDAQASEARLIAERDGAPAPTYPQSLMARASDPEIALVLAGQDKIFETRRSLQKSKTDLIQQRIAETNEEIVGLQAQEASDRQRIALINEEIYGLKQLVDKGLERKPRLLALQRDLAEIEGKRGDTLAQIARAQENIAESRVSILNQQNDMQNEVASSLRDTQKKIHELDEQIQAAQDVLSRIEVRAPEDGIVTDLKVHTPGGVVTAGEPLLDLVPPTDRLVIQAQVRPEDINLVRAGLPALVRLTPYKQRRTPPLEATVEYVSPDRLVDKHTNQPYYAAKVRVDEEKLKKVIGIEMIPGMPAEVSIKTGESTVAMYALSPVLDSFRRAFREP